MVQGTSVYRHILTSMLSGNGSYVLRQEYNSDVAKTHSSEFFV